MEKFINDLLGRMTLEEKIDMIHGSALFHTKGVDRLAIPPLVMSDGPMGVRAEMADDEWRAVGNTDDAVTYLPCNSAVASTWNRKLARLHGETLGEEARGRGKDVILAPGINIKRTPLNGRNFEYMSEDPRLTEEMTVPMVEGIQSQDVASCLKHFALNSQETYRLWVDTHCEERARREIYYPGFEAAVKRAKLYSIMGAYNLIDGEHCCQSGALLKNLLRDEWGFDGCVISDWGAVHDTKKAAEGGLDIEMDVHYDFDHHFMAEPLKKAIEAGEIEEATVDDKVRNILRTMYRLKMIGPDADRRKSGTYNSPEHRKAALAVAREGLVLLKNEDGLLPLADKAKTVAVIGANAVTVHSAGGGSAELKVLYEITPLMGIKKLLGGNTKVSYAPGYLLPAQEVPSTVSWQASSTDKASYAKDGEDSASSEEDEAARRAAAALKLKEEALALAKEADAVIYVGGLTHEDDLEGKDRTDMKLPYGQDDLLFALLQERPDTVVCLCAGSPVEMPWLSLAKAVVLSYYNGMEGGTALAEAIFGRINPSGKLAETWPLCAGDCRAVAEGNFAREDLVEYKEGIYVGYRDYDSAEKPVSFCFGHGLSYTQFAYSDLAVKEHLVWTKDAKSEPDRPVVTLSFTLTNTGNRAGAEIAELYLAPLETSCKDRPVHELKNFEKVYLEAGESKKVTLTLAARDFTYYSMEQQAFSFDPGTYRIEVAASARDIRLTETVKAV